MAAGVVTSSEPDGARQALAPCCVSALDTLLVELISRRALARGFREVTGR
jgi:hypothetical protein